MKASIVFLIALTALTTSTFSATLIHASATVGTAGQTTGGGAITSSQFLGTRFELTSLTDITAIGGHFFAPPGSNTEMFGAIISLDSLSSAPEGSPFNSADFARMALFTTVNVPSASSLDYVFPVSATLSPGFYGLIFGKGQFGASSQGVVGAAEGGANLAPDYMVWSQSSTWRNGGFPNARLTVYGNTVPEPSRVILLAFGAALCLLRRSFRTWNGGNGVRLPLPD